MAKIYNNEIVKIIDLYPHLIMPGTIDKIINPYKKSPATTIEDQYLRKYRGVISNPRSLVVNAIEAHKICADIDCSPDKIQEAYDRGEIKRKKFLNQRQR